jgi:HAMP domain-containing protein
VHLELYLNALSLVMQRTNELIGVATVEYLLSTMSEILVKGRLFSNSQVAIVRVEDGAMYADTMNITTGLNSTAEFPVPLATTLFAPANEQNASSFWKSRMALNFDVVWDPEEVKYSLVKMAFQSSIGLVMPSLIPAVPDAYDPKYRPRFVVLNTVSEDIFQEVRDVQDNVDQDVAIVVSTTVGLGLAGFLLVGLVVFGVARMLTQPLQWIERLSFRIVNHSNEPKSKGGLRLSDDEGLTAKAPCSPSTEIDQLVSEFRAMVQGFSGTGLPKVAVVDPFEIQNRLTWHSDFHKLYKRESIPPRSKARREISEATRSTEASSLGPCHDDQGNFVTAKEASPDEPVQEETNKGRGNIVPLSLTVVPAPPKKNQGSNILCANGIDESKGRKDVVPGEKSIRWTDSSLYWWILGLVVLPLLVIIGTIVAVTYSTIVTRIPAWMHDLEQASFEVELQSLVSYAQVSALGARSNMRSPARDVYFVGRVAGWLAAGGVETSVGLTEIQEQTSSCQFDLSEESCVVRNDAESSSKCPCYWEDSLDDHPCSETVANVNSTRSTLYWMSQSRDANPETGSRVEPSSYPEYDWAPNATGWWNDTQTVPGVELGDSRIGVSTTYDRIQVSSAVGVVEFPVLNYRTALGQNSVNLATYIAFEDDGLMSGLAGCGHPNAFGAYFQSSAEYVSQICPEGKFGYDPRCRPFYVKGKERWLNHTEPISIGHQHSYAGSDSFVASTISMVLHDTLENEFLGIVGIDVSLSQIHHTSRSRKGHWASLLLNPIDGFGVRYDSDLGHDHTSHRAVPVQDLLFLAYDVSSRGFFTEHIFPDLLMGREGWVKFARLGESGFLEQVYLAYTPVTLAVPSPVQPADFSRGSMLKNVSVFLTGTFTSENEMKVPFLEVENSIHDDLELLGNLDIGLATTLSVLFCVFAFRVCIKRCLAVSRFF